MEKLMNRNEFEEYVRSTVEAALPPEQAGAKVSIMHSGDGGVLMRITRPWTNNCPRFLLTSAYENYLYGNITAESVVAKILNNRNLYRVLPDIRGNNIFDFKKARERIVSRIVSSQMQIKGRPVIYSETMPIATIWELHVSDMYHEAGTQAGIPVTWDLMDAWGISVGELERIAKENSPELRPVMIDDMELVLRNEGIPCWGCTMGTMLIVTNTEKQNGAVTVTYPGVREQLMEMLHDDVYILPSSTHECIAVAKSGLNPVELYDIVCKVNQTTVEIDDFLANDVWEYAPDGSLTSVICRLAREEKSVLTIEEERIFE